MPSKLAAAALLGSLLLIAWFQARTPLPDPEGTWHVYHGEATTPTYTLVIKPIRGGWTTDWAMAAGGEVYWTGTMQRYGDAGFTEWWRSCLLPVKGEFLWLWGDGGAVADGSNLNLRK